MHNMPFKQWSFHPSISLILQATSWYSPLLVEDSLDILKYLPEMDENVSSYLD